MKFNELDKRMRVFEGRLDEKCPKDEYIVIRLDGRGFTKLTKSALEYDRPFDIRFHEAMCAVCEHLMQIGLETTVCYTQSDEISILLDSREVSFNGKTRKINSIFASEASGVFSLKVGLPTAFDCRVCPLPQQVDVVDYFRWRAEDARRNALSAYCYWGLRDKGLSPSVADQRLHGFSGPEKRQFIADEIGIHFDELPGWHKFGALAHWKHILHEGLNPTTGETTETTRRRLNWLENIPTGEHLSKFVFSKLNEVTNKLRKFT